MKKITKLVGAMSIGALAMVGCKSSEPAPADNQGGATEPAKADGSSCGADSQPADGSAKPAEGGGSCGGGH